MTTRKVRLGHSATERLLAALRAVPTEPVGPCLSEEACADFVVRDLSLEEAARVETHLASCPNCATAVEELLAALHARDVKERVSWFRQQAAQVAAAARAVADGARELVAIPFGPPLAAGAHFAAMRSRYGETPDGGARWKLERDDDGVTVTVTSDRPAFEGFRLKVRWGSAEKELLLSEVLGAIVGVVRFSREELANVDEGSVPEFILDADPDGRNV